MNNTKFSFDPAKLILISDTREQKNEHILSYFNSKGIKVHETALKSGDYSFIYNEVNYSESLIIERKNSLTELSSNFTNGRERFENEFKRTSAKVFCLVECSESGIAAIKGGRYQTNFAPKAFTASILTFMFRYGITFEFCPKNLIPEYIYQLIYYYLREKNNYIK